MFDLLKQKITYHLVLPFLVLLCVLVWLAVLVFPDNRLRVIFCNVGQGDAILISQGLHQMLIDGGPDSSVLNCLNQHLPFFDKKIDIVALTHPESDHFGGLMYVLDKYKVDYFLSNGVGNGNNPAYAGLVQSSQFTVNSRPNLLRKQNANLKVKNVYTGDKIIFGDLQLKVLWPERKWVEERLLPNDQQLAMNNEQPATNFPLNSFGLVFLVSSHNTKYLIHNTFLLMADVDSTTQDELLKANPNMSQVDVLKFPHHGSKTGMSEAFLQRIAPMEAVISVGQNTFGHPTQEVLEMLEKYGIRIRRTDQIGDVVYY